MDKMHHLTKPQYRLFNEQCQDATDDLLQQIVNVQAGHNDAKANIKAMQKALATINSVHAQVEQMHGGIQYQFKEPKNG